MLKNIILKFIAVLLALFAWQAAVDYVDLEILFPSPIDVFKRLLTLHKEETFVSTVTFTFGKIFSGFIRAYILGVVMGIIAGRWRVAEALFWPYSVTVKSVPVACFIIIALLWVDTENLAYLISFLMVLPIVYTNVLQGYKSIDKKKTEIADVFRLPFHKRLIYIYLPTLKPFLISACSVSFGLAWKSGVAAEFIGQPENSIGEVLYYAKMYIEPVDLFAWTFVLVIISVCFEKLMVGLLKLGFKGVEKL